MSDITNDFLPTTCILIYEFNCKLRLNSYNFRVLLYNLFAQVLHPIV